MMQQIANFGLVLVAAIAIGTSTTTTSAFTSPLVNAGRMNIANALQTPRTSASALAASTQTDVLVISPPGGIGETSAIEAARLGGSVKWFVVSAPEKTPDPAKPLSFTAETLAAITKSGGSMELAGASADALLDLDVGGETSTAEVSNTNSALAAMTSWCITSPKSIICTYDGAMEEKTRVDRTKTAEEREMSANNEVEMICSGVRVAAREISSGTTTRSSGGGGAASMTKIALLAAGEEIAADNGNDDKENGGGGLFAGLFGGNDRMEVPSSMEEALGGSVNAVIRYGELFGAPESSVRFLLGLSFIFMYTSSHHLMSLSLSLVLHGIIYLQSTNKHNNTTQHSLNHHPSWEDHDVILPYVKCTLNDRYASILPLPVEMPDPSQIVWHLERLPHV